ncbi:MAG: hypothetical protein H6878_13520 [Rhodobiaceae bacterium]|nr:hypothetical protein [Rhodobiaceae bacterium]MCC0041855.1 hypothetical protein [Rhodobiaceae bacterium]
MTMANEPKTTEKKRPDALEDKFRSVGINAVAAAARYCGAPKRKQAERHFSPQMSASVYDTD